METTDLVQLTVHGVLADPNTETQIVILRDDQHAEVLPIWVGMAEGNAIKLAIEGVIPPRPMSHDLICGFANHLGIRVNRVVVTDVKNNTYYASIDLTCNGLERSIDSRPSDAIALALRTNSPIYVTKDVLKRRSGDNLEEWLDKLDPKHFGKHEA